MTLPKGVIHINAVKDMIHALDTATENAIKQDPDMMIHYGSTSDLLWAILEYHPEHQVRRLKHAELRRIAEG